MTKNTLVYFGSYSLSVLGNGIASVLFPLLVLARTGDILAAGIVASVTAAVGAVAGVFAGVVVDRVNRRTVSIVSDLLSAGSVAALPLVDAVWGLNLAWFIGLGVIGAFGDMPGMTARESMLPRLVSLSGGKSGALDRLVGTREALTAALIMAGPGIGGALVWLTGVSSAAMLITAGTSLGAALLSLFLSPRAGDISLEGDASLAGVPAGSAGSAGSEEPAKSGTAGGSRVRGVLRELVDGWRFLAGNSLVRAATLLSALSVTVLTALQVAVLPAYFTEENVPGLAGLAMTGIAFGSLLGAGVFAVTAGRVSRRTWFVIGIAGSLLGFLAVGSLASPWFVIAGAAFIGLTNGPFSAVLGVALIEAIPDHLRGKVLGAQNAILLAGPAFAVAPIAAFASGFGLVAAGYGIAIAVAVALLAALFAPALRSLDVADDAGAATMGGEGGSPATLPADPEA